MPITNLYALHAVEIDGAVIGQITDQAISADVSEILTGSSGDVYNRQAAMDLIDCRIRFSTEAVKTLLAKLGLVGLHVTTGHTVAAYFAQYTPGGTRTPNGFVKMTIAEGLAVWRSLAAPEGGLASATAEIIGISPDGATAPWVKATGQAGPTIPDAPDMWVLDGTEIRNFDIDTGIGLQLQRSDGDPYPTFVAIESIQPRITVRRLGADDLASSAAAIGSLQLQQVTAGGLRTASNITFTFSQKMTVGRSMGGNPMINEALVVPTYNGTNLPIVMTGLT